MDPKVVLIFTWLVAGLVIALYIWFVVWRYRAERRKKAEIAAGESAMSDAIAKTAAQPTASGARIGPSATESHAETAGVLADPLSVIGAPVAEATVAGLLSGIALPNDLVPLSTIGPRAAVGDRVAFWTNRAPAEIVGPAFADELERLGYTVQSLDEQSLSAERGNDRLLVVVHPDGERAIVSGELAFTTVPELSVVIEVWVPA